MRGLINNKFCIFFFFFYNNITDVYGLWHLKTIIVFSLFYHFYSFMIRTTTSYWFITLPSLKTVSASENEQEKIKLTNTLLKYNWYFRTINVCGVIRTKMKIVIVQNYNIKTMLNRNGWKIEWYFTFKE